MKKIFFCFVLFGLFCSLNAKGQNDNYPQFSWDRIPVCIHLSNGNSDFSPSQIEFMARFPIVCIEKNQAFKKYRSMEIGTLNAAKSIKKLNSQSKILFYWNSRIDYSDFYKYGKPLEEHPDWAMKDKNGDFVTVQKIKRKTYDVTNPFLRNWWCDFALGQISNDNLDGVFIDAVSQYVVRPTLKEKLFGKNKFADIQNGLHLMLSQLKDSVRDEKLLIGNFLRGNKELMDDMGMHFLEYTDGGMIEHFCALSGDDKENIANDIFLIQEAAKKKKIVIVKGWPRFNFTQPEKYKNLTPAELENILRKDIVFPLACFLIAAGEYSYFCYSLGYRDTEGGLIDYDEYNRPLGKPLSEAKRNGWIYTREFEYADIWIDIENRLAKINWRK